MFRVFSIDVASARPLRMFVGHVEGEGRVDAFAITADIAASLGLVTSTIRGEISKHSLGTLRGNAQLKSWLIQNDIIPVGSGKVNFADSALLLKVLKRHLSAAVFESCRARLGIEIKQGVTIDEDPIEDFDDIADRNPIIADDIESDSNILQPIYAASSVDPEDEEVAEIVSALCAAVEGGNHAQSEQEKQADDDVDFVLLESSSDGEDVSFHVEKSSSSGVGSSSSSDSSDVLNVLPEGVSELVMTVPQIPSDFSVSDFTKAHSLKSYNIGQLLKKELKKLGKWWTSERNSERKSKAISPTTAGKREERLLCFLGFVERYRAVPKTFDLTLALILNHRLVEAYCDYMTTVRKSSFGNLSETMTSLISCARWLYRKDKSGAEPQIIRRYKDWRNLYQAKAARIRKGDDIEELTERGKWLSWEDFVALIRRLRKEWISLAIEPVSVRTARKLHDLLLLGLYSCVPARGSEVRLLQFMTEEQVTAEKDKLTIKKWVDSKKINLITRVGTVHKMFVSDFKNYRSVGIDVTELDSFDWWCTLFELYVTSYRSALVVRECDHLFVFVTKTGKPFSGSYWSDYISSLLFEHAGVSAATNLLRSSFVSSFYESASSNDPKLAESVAAVLRHSSKEAKKTYDRRTATQRKRPGLDLIAKMSSTPKVTSKKRLSFGSGIDVDDLEETPLLQDIQRATKTQKMDGTVVGLSTYPAPQVVEFDHHPHAVIRTEGIQYLLAPMQRSSFTNAPVYFVAPTAHFFPVPMASCKNTMRGKWVGREFTLI